MWVIPRRWNSKPICSLSVSVSKSKARLFSEHYSQSSLAKGAIWLWNHSQLRVPRAMTLHAIPKGVVFSFLFLLDCTHGCNVHMAIMKTSWAQVCQRIRKYLEGCDALDSDCSLVFGAGCGKHPSLAMDQGRKQPKTLLQAQHKRTVTHWRL